MLRDTDSFQELMDTTSWESYGTESGNPKCANCMVHSGYEASTVDHGFGSIGGFVAMARATLFPRKTFGEIKAPAPVAPRSNYGARPGTVTLTLNAKPIEAKPIEKRSSDEREATHVG